MADCLMHLICPNSPSIWNINRFSKCFGNIVLGFGVNAVTTIMILVLGVTQKGGERNSRIKPSEKFSLHFLPAIGVCLSFLDMTLCLKRTLSGESVAYHEWFFSCSRFALWIATIFFSKCANLHQIFSRHILCLWWILKALLGISILLMTVSASEILGYLKEIFFVLLDVMFCISVNVVRIKSGSPKSSSLEDSLLSVGMESEEGCYNDISYWDRMTFRSITSIMDNGVKKQLDFEDLLQLPTDMDPSFCHEILSSCWRDQQSHNCSSPSLFKAIFGAYGWPYIHLGLLKVVNDSIGFAGPMLLNRLIRFLQQGSWNWDGYALAILMGLASVFKSFFDTQYTFHLSKLKLKLRSSLMIAIYHKCLSISLAERSKFSKGEIQTFMSVDADRVVNLGNSLHDVWSLPFQIIVALYLLYTQVKFAFLSGLTITILLIPVNKWISKLIASATEKMMKQKDERIRKTEELLTHVRTLKMFGWELLFSSWLMETRSSEMKHLSTRKYLDAWCVFFWATTPTLFSLFTFGLFTLMGYQLDAATVFTCLALFNTLISPLNSFPWVINGLIDAAISMGRLSRFLSCSEHKIEPKKSSPFFSNDKSPSSSEDLAIVISDACCSWSSSEDYEQNMAVNHVTLDIHKGIFIAVIGEVGSGKSSLLKSILGETHLVDGSILASRSIAYVPQVPWILSGTFRDNILFGKSYEHQRYLDTIQACALDIDISLMSGGDMAYIGDRGLNLSGGQRARLALARAIYHGSDILLLDDVLSAVDARVAQWILHNAIMGSLAKQKTCVLCTHNHQAISSADKIAVMDKGQVSWVGKSADLSMSLYSALSPSQELDSSSQLKNGECSIDASIKDEQNHVEQNDLVHTSETAQEIVEAEQRKEGRVELGVYKNYAAFCGWVITVVICLSAILMQVSRNGNDLWLSYWVDTTKRGSRAEKSTSFYLVINFPFYPLVTI